MEELNKMLRQQPKLNEKDFEKQLLAWNRTEKMTIPETFLERVRYNNDFTYVEEYNE